MLRFSVAPSRLHCLAALVAISFSVSALAAEPRAKKAADAQAIPYLGPGSDKLSASEYERVYKNYIQTSVLLGYPFFKEQPAACDQALTAIFRGAGFLGYPVPAEAQQLKRGTRNLKGSKVETYEGAGILIQVARNSAGAPQSLILVNSSSVKAIRRLAGFAKTELLTLEKDPVTGLEKVRGIPVGYPHPFLTADGQGLFVKELRFNGKVDGCQPLGFVDNTWVAGFELSESRCAELQGEAEKVWHEEISPADFAERELKRMKDAAMKAALAKGTKEAEAKGLVEKHFQPPFTNEINVVGSAMRNLAQCNLLALGRAAKAPPKGSSPTEAQPGSQGEGAGSAK